MVWLSIPLPAAAGHPLRVFQYACRSGIVIILSEYIHRQFVIERVEVFGFKILLLYLICPFHSITLHRYINHELSNTMQLNCLL